jgi:NOL1/NOP2/sun family putative RNA methylase
MDRIEIPSKFSERYGRIVDVPQEFLAALSRPLPKAFRVNTLKADVNDVLTRLGSYGMRVKPVGWYDSAFVVEGDDSLRLGATLEHFMGHIYIQELVSMLPPLLLREELERIGNALVLDACAAPGSKTTQLAALMRNGGLIVANDSAFGRLKIIKHNLEKLGVMNTAVINRDVRFFTPDLQFDCIILDAPCSSEGTMRKNPEVIRRWSEKAIASLSNIQKQMITRCYDMLKPEGVMVYSTCTFAPEENEAVVDYLIGKTGCALESIAINGIKSSDPLKEWKGREFHAEVRKAARIWPHHNDTGGFFLAKIRKAEAI